MHMSFVATELAACCIGYMSKDPYFSNDHCTICSILDEDTYSSIPEKKRVRHGNG